MVVALRGSECCLELCLCVSVCALTVYNTFANLHTERQLCDAQVAKRLLTHLGKGFGDGSKCLGQCQRANSNRKCLCRCFIRWSLT